MPLFLAKPFMESNPYLDHSVNQNPYLKTAVQDAATAQIMHNLAKLLAEETTVAVPSPAPAASSPSGYGSVAETMGASGGSAYVSCTDDSGLIAASHPPAQRSEPSTPLIGDRPIPPAQPTAYYSPEAVVQAEQHYQRQLQVQARQEALQQQRLAQAQAQQAAAARRELEKRAKQFLAKLDKMDPLEGDRMWFESFVRLCPSRLEAAIEFIQTIRDAESS